MTARMQHESAKIYQFPTGGRAADTRRLGGNFGLTKLERELASLPFATTAIGDGWYHDDAIRDDDLSGKH